MISAILLLATQLSAQTAKARLESAIRDVRAAAATEEKLSSNWKDLGPMITTQLEASQKDLQAGRYFSAVEKLGRAKVLVDSSRSARRAEAEGKAGLAAAAKKATGSLSAAKPVAAAGTDEPAAVRAMIENARFRGPVMLQAAGAYGEATDPGSGFFYLGEGESHLAFAKLVHSLGFTRSGSPMPARSPGPELAELQSQTNQTFKPPLSQELHSQFIRLNAALKSAEELDAAGLYYGALYQYLDAMQAFAALKSAGQPLADVHTLRGQLDAAAATLAKSTRDVSIPLLFVQRAQSALSAEKPEEAFVRASAAIVNAVLPAYEAFEKQPARMATAPENRVIDVTLVRWPYT
jgi:hypothetical protein